MKTIIAVAVTIVAALSACGGGQSGDVNEKALNACVAKANAEQRYK